MARNRARGFTRPALILFVGFLIAALRLSSAQDALSAELRERVEQLKREAGDPSVSMEVLGERLATLWEWGNALALEGVVIPVDFPSTVSRNYRLVRGESAAGTNASLDRLAPAIARFVREFQVKEERPGAIGRIVLSPPGPFRAGQAVTLKQVYTVGEMPMRAGGGVVLGLRGSIAARLAGTGAEDYVAVSTSNPKASLERGRPWARWGGIYLGRGNVAYRLRGADLAPGDTITVTIGGTNPYGLQLASNDRVIFPMYVDLEGKGNLFTPDWPSFEVIGQSRVARVRAVGPSILTPGERFDLAVLSEDGYKNRASGPAPAYAVTLNGEPFRELDAGADAVNVLEGLTLDEPGVYRFGLRSADGLVTGSSNPIWVREDAPWRIYWGDTHGHTGFAEGQGSPDGYFKFGRDFARLDFITLSEHDIWLDDNEWGVLGEAVGKYIVPGRFTPILGYEWTARNPIGGHHNVYFRTPEDRERVGLQTSIDVGEMHAKLKQIYDPEDVLVIPHAHQAGDWRRSDPDLELLVEMTSSHGTFEGFGNKYLQNGWEVGFIGSSDNHGGHPGYTGIQGRQRGGLAGVFAPENSAGAIFAALRSRDAYATTGERIILDATLNGSPMGRRIKASDERKIECRVMGTEPIDGVDVIKNGKVIYTKRYAGGAIGSRVWAQVGFESSTDVFSRANPRGPRPWRGSIEVKGGRLLSIKRPEFANPMTDHFMREAENANRLSFDFTTRGRAKDLVLEIAEASAATTLEIKLDRARERPGSPGAPDRAPAALPGEDLSFALGRFASAPLRHELRVVRNVDSIRLQLVAPDAALDQRFEFTDHDDPRPGDYYYIRVRQVGGAIAWSSPAWVGRKPAG